MYIMVINKFLIQCTHKPLSYHLNTIVILTKGTHNVAVLRKKFQVPVLCNLQALNLIKKFQNAKCIGQIIHQTKKKFKEWHNKTTYL